MKRIHGHLTDDEYYSNTRLALPACVVQRADQRYSRFSLLDQAAVRRAKGSRRIPAPDTLHVESIDLCLRMLTQYRHGVDRVPSRRM